MPQNCERCKKETTHTIMSLFNQEMCCKECIEKERAHPKFKEATSQQLEEMQKGNYNFSGIGLPDDLK